MRKFVIAVLIASSVVLGPIAGAARAEAVTGISLPDTNLGDVQFYNSKTVLIVVTNTTGLSVNYGSWSTNSPEFTVNSDPSGVPGASRCWEGPFASGASCSVSVTVSPGGLGVRKAVLSVSVTQSSNSASLGTATAQLSANSVNGVLALPSTIDFGSVPVGELRTKVVELANDGIGNIQFENPSTNDSQFNVSLDPDGVPGASRCWDVSYLQPGGRCSISVTFKPGASGPRSGTLTIPTFSGTFTAALTGGGSRAGYWMLSASGSVYEFGNLTDFGSPSLTGFVFALKIEPTPSGNGYWILASNGSVYAYGDATNFGNVDTSTLAAGEGVRSLSATPSGHGYWVFTSRGRVLPFGDAAFFGDVSKLSLNGPVLGSVSTPTGQGYYMVASDGGIFAFGDAKFHGSMGGAHLNAPVQSIVPTADNGGYWLVASDGGIFAFGAPFRGSMGGARLNRPVNGMIRFGDGYLMVASDGGIFNFSDQQFYGSLGDDPPSSQILSVGAVE